jgi:hypothetical protein
VRLYLYEPDVEVSMNRREFLRTGAGATAVAAAASASTGPGPQKLPSVHVRLDIGFVQV